MLSYKKINFMGEESPMTAAEALRAKKAAETLRPMGFYPEIRIDIHPKMGVFTPKKSLRRQIGGKYNFSKITPAYLV